MPLFDCHTSINNSNSNNNPLWKTTQGMTELTLNSLVFDVDSSCSKKIDWPCSSPLLLSLPTTTTTTSTVTSSTSTASATTTTDVIVTTVNVPQDFESLADAVAFANSEFEKHAATVTAESRQTQMKTIQILIDPRRVPLCQMEEPLRVEARKYGHLIVDVLQKTASTDDDSSNNKRQRKSERASSEAPLKAVVSMETRKANQPLLHHTSGQLTLRNLRLDHFSPVDMFQLAKTKSQNAALLLEHGALDNVTSCKMEHVAVTSFSGRGILNRCHHPTVKVVEHDCFVAKLWS